MKDAPKSKVVKILKYIGNIVFYSILAFLIIFSIANMKLKKENDIASIFGKGFMTVQTGSMIGSNPDSFTTDDIILVNIFKSKDATKIFDNDIVVFYKLDLDDNPNNGSTPGFVTHRVVGSITVNEIKYFITKGDANPTEDEFAISAEEIIAIYTNKLVGAGRILKYMQSPQGFAVTIIIPVAVMFLLQGIFLVRNIIQLNKEKVEEHLESAKEANMKALEAEKEKMRQQILEEIKAQQNN